MFQNVSMSHADDKIDRIISAFLICPRLEDAAKHCGMSRTTLWRISQDSEFKRRLSEAQARLSEQIVTTLQANTLDAVVTLREVMVDKHAPTSTRVAAAGRLIDYSLRARHQLDIEQRLKAVELVLRTRKRGKNGS